MNSRAQRLRSSIGKIWSYSRSPKFIWAPVYSCTHWLRPRNPPPPAFGLIYEGAIGLPTTSLFNPLGSSHQGTKYADKVIILINLLHSNVCYIIRLSRTKIYCTVQSSYICTTVLYLALTKRISIQGFKYLSFGKILYKLFAA
jgi:hypothetical protein